MAPCPTSYPTVHHLRMTEKEHIKLRKPIVEKMRRDRINSCIEQLKVILEREFPQQEPNSKLEKADILEMTVNFLRHQLQAGQHLRLHGQSCWADPSSPTGPLTPLRQGKMLKQAHKDISSPTAGEQPKLQESRSSSAVPVWRPW